MRLNPSSRPDFGNRQARTRPTKTRRDLRELFSSTHLLLSCFFTLRFQLFIKLIPQRGRTSSDRRGLHSGSHARHTGASGKGKRLLLRVFLLPDVERCAALINAIMTFYLNAEECSRSPRGPKAVRVGTTLQTNKEVNTGENNIHKYYLKCMEARFRH